MIKLFLRIISYLGNRFFIIGNRNKNYTIISRDCIGGVLYSQYKEKFLSPTINLYMGLTDFNYFCIYLMDYIYGTLDEDYNNSVSFPVGVIRPEKENLPTIKIFFRHYNNFDEAKQKWNDRKNRINWNNIFVISSCYNRSETDTVTEDDIQLWNSIKYKKMIFVDKNRGFVGEYVLDKPHNVDSSINGWALISNSKVMLWKRIFNQYNFNKFLNKR